jgi:hypothetical protein
MRRLETALPSGPALRALDAAIALWTLAWLALGIVVGAQLQGLADLSDTVAQVGVAVEDSAELFDLLGGLPLIGELPAQIGEVGRSAQETAQSSRENIDALTALLAPTIALMPSLPLLALYLPARLARSREAQAVAEAHSRSGDDPAFRELLARRAAQNLTYRELASVSSEPWRDLAEGRHDALAQAELARLGLAERAPREEPKRRVR